MAIARGWTEADIRRHEAVFDGLVSKAVRMSLRSLTADLHVMTAAAREPQPMTFGQSSVVAATWNSYVGSELFPYLVQTFVDSADAVAEVVNDAIDVAVPPVTYSYAAGYLTNASNRLVGLGDQVWNAVREQLALGYDSGESIHQLAARVRSVAQVTEKRALMIARTEVASAANQGSLYQLLTAGFTDQECEKGWLATDDERTRLAHAVFLNPVYPGKWVGLTQPFIVGGEGLQCPGDPTGRPDNIINCRCTLEFRFHDDSGPLTAGFGRRVKQWIEALHPRDDLGKFTEKGGGAAAHDVTHVAKSTGSLAPKFQPPQFHAPPKFKFKPTQPVKWEPSTPEPGAPDFHIIPGKARGASGDGYYAPGMWGRFGAAGVMVRAKDPSGQERFLVVRRQGGKGHGKWQLPGGALDQRETPEQGAARETFEEVGTTPQQLAQLTRVGVHRVSQHVPGKTPWTYHNIAADAPATFNVSNIDRHELSGAAWLTRQQLRTMKQHGLLVYPFAQHLESIFSTFPDTLTASLNGAKFRWIESEHPRLPNGEFTEVEHAFDWLTPHEADQMQNEMLRSANWKREQETALRGYARSSYVAINTHLRGGDPSPSSTTLYQIAHITNAMRPTTRPVRVRRAVYADSFEGMTVGGDFESMIGRTYEDPGFLSTTLSPDFLGTAGYGRNTPFVLLDLEVPTGTQAAYLGGPHGPGVEAEHELLLQRGTRFKITHVGEETNSRGQKAFVVHGRVVHSE